LKSISNRERKAFKVKELLSQRVKAVPLIRGDVFSYLLKARDSQTEEGLSQDETGAESTTMIVAGV
jgi:cytochrome P450